MDLGRLVVRRVVAVSEDVAVAELGCAKQVESLRVRVAGRGALERGDIDIDDHLAERVVAARSRRTGPRESSLFCRASSSGASPSGSIM